MLMCVRVVGGGSDVDMGLQTHTHTLSLPLTCTRTHTLTHMHKKNIPASPATPPAPARPPPPPASGAPPPPPTPRSSPAARRRLRRRRPIGGRTPGGAGPIWGGVGEGSARWGGWVLVCICLCVWGGSGGGWDDGWGGWVAASDRSVRCQPSPPDRSSSPPLTHPPTYQQQGRGAVLLQHGGQPEGGQDSPRPVHHLGVYLCVVCVCVCVCVCVAAEVDGWMAWCGGRRGGGRLCVTPTTPTHHPATP